MTPTNWTDSADRHDVAHADALHAMRNPLVFIEEFDEARVEGHTRPVSLWIGRGRDGVLLEVMAHLNRKAQDVLIFHVMELRPKTLDRARAIMKEMKGE
jgi:hypothetical protein